MVINIYSHDKHTNWITKWLIYVQGPHNVDSWTILLGYFTSKINRNENSFQIATNNWKKNIHLNEAFMDPALYILILQLIFWLQSNKTMEIDCRVDGDGARWNMLNNEGEYH
jgi:hypothetical protein